VYTLFPFISRELGTGTWELVFLLEFGYRTISEFCRQFWC
jgi:thiamine phosphate synthase YjbQ (UPF0047 family)